MLAHGHASQVCNLSSLPKEELDAVLAATAVGEVWGVGRRISAQLIEGGVTTVLDLVRADAATIRSKFSVVVERTVRELQGTQCVDLESVPQPKQEIACTRSFGNPVTELHELAEAVTEFASRAAQKLRKQHSLAGQVLCFVRTSPFRSDSQYSRSITVPLRRPSADTAQIVGAALAGLRAIYRPDYKIAKAGVMLLELQSASVQQHELALEDDDVVDRSNLMVTLDGLNLRYGRGTVSMASAGLAGDRRAWSMKQERRTPQYTTNWNDLAVARA